MSVENSWYTTVRTIIYDFCVTPSPIHIGDGMDPTTDDLSVYSFVGQRYVYPFGLLTLWCPSYSRVLQYPNPELSTQSLPWISLTLDSPLLSRSVSRKITRSLSSFNFCMRLRDIKSESFLSRTNVPLEVRRLDLRPILRSGHKEESLDSSHLTVVNNCSTPPDCESPGLFQVLPTMPNLLRQGRF